MLPLPGIPRVSRGTSAPPTMALFDASAAISPSCAPLPYDFLRSGEAKATDCW